MTWVTSLLHSIRGRVHGQLVNALAGSSFALISKWLPHDRWMITLFFLFFFYNLFIPLVLYSLDYFVCPMQLFTFHIQLVSLWFHLLFWAICFPGFWFWLAVLFPMLSFSLFAFSYLLDILFARGIKLFNFWLLYSWWFLSWTSHFSKFHSH